MRKYTICYLFIAAAFFLLVFASGCTFSPKPVIRPLDVWAFRSVLDLQPRMLTVALDTDCYIAYNLAQCKLYKVWKGGVLLEGAPYTGKKEIQPASWGTAYFTDTVQTVRWSVELNGKNIFSEVLYRGYVFKNNQIFLKFALVLTTQDTIQVEERPEVLHKGNKIGLERLIKTSNVPHDARVRLTLQDTSVSLKSNGTAPFILYFDTLPAQYAPIAKPIDVHIGRALMDKNDCFTCHKLEVDEVGPSFKNIAIKYSNNKESFALLSDKIKTGGTGTWGTGMMNPHPALTENELNEMVNYIFTLKSSKIVESISVKNKASRMAKPLPKKPGWGAPLEGVHPGYDLISLHTTKFKPRVGGLAFLPDGRLLVTTWDKEGGLYLLDSLSTADTTKIKVKRIAFGLAEPLGIEVVDGEIYVLQKQELTRLVDLDGDDVIDEYQVVCNSWTVSPDFHEFAFGLVYQNGFFYATLSMAMRLKPGEKQLSDRGKTIKISKDGHFEAVNFGLRTPNGIGVGLDNEIFITDNQGQWLPANKLIHLKKGEYHGMKWGWLSDEPAPEMAMPAIWLPEDEIGNSPSEPVLIKDGIYKGQLLHGDVTYGGINRDFLEKINGEYQGAVFRFSQGFEAGVNRMRWGTDGNLYIGEVGMVGGGWSWKNRVAGLQCLKYNGKSTFEMLTVRAISRGFEIEFTQPLAISFKVKPSDIFMQQWWYLPTEKYGGPKMDLENLSPGKISISPDRTRVSIEIPNLKPKHVVYIRLPELLKSSSGQSLWSGETWYTLNQIPN